MLLRLILPWEEKQKIKQLLGFPILNNEFQKWIWSEVFEGYQSYVGL